MTPNNPEKNTLRTEQWRLHWKLQSGAFPLSPNPLVFFEEHFGETYHQLAISIRKGGKGLNLLLGESGNGKSLLVNKLLAEIAGQNSHNMTMISARPENLTELIQKILYQLDPHPEQQVNNEPDAKTRFLYLMKLHRKWKKKLLICADSVEGCETQFLLQLKALLDLSGGQTQILYLSAAAEAQVLREFKRCGLTTYLEDTGVLRGFASGRVVKAYVDYMFLQSGQNPSPMTKQAAETVSNALHLKNCRRVNLLIRKALEIACLENAKALKPEHMELAFVSLFPDEVMIEQNKTQIETESAQRKKPLEERSQQNLESARNILRQMEQTQKTTTDPQTLDGGSLN